jgi:hypothetical protein
LDSNSEIFHFLSEVFQTLTLSNFISNKWDTWQHRSSPLRKAEPSPGTRGSAGAHLSKEARSGVVGHVAASVLTSARRRGLGSWDMWQRRSSHQQGGKVQS